MNPDTNVKATASLCLKNSFVPSINRLGVNFIRFSIGKVSGCLFQNQTIIKTPKTKLK